MVKVEIKNGTVYLEGKPFYLSSAEYPYSRDRAENWDNRLDKLRNCGVKVITCYFPWRHHELLINGERRFDFTGYTRDNRNVVRFLQLCQEKDLLVVAKPGPFIHAETNYGGLPDFVCPLNSPEIEAMLDHRGRPVTWPGSDPSDDGKSAKPWPLPAPLDSVFLKNVQHWFKRVQEEIVSRFTYPEGPIFLVQLANEGIYSNAQRPPWEYDYSNSSLEYFRQCLREGYGSLSKYNELHDTAYSSWEEIEPVREWKQSITIADLLAYMDWSSYQWRYMREIYRLYSSFLSTELPCMVNMNPPLPDAFGLDAWLSRVNPDEWPNVHYGFTNWIGIASDDPSVVERYLVLTKRRKGPNLEENWGLTEPYGYSYRFAATCYSQTLLAIAGGATGYNIYTGAGTSLWDDHLDRFQKKPYPSHAPIDESGEVTPKAQIMSFLNNFFENYGGEFLESRSPKPIAWVIYLPFAYIGAWSSGRSVHTCYKNGDHREGFRIPKCGTALTTFQRWLISSNIDYGLENLQAVSVDILREYPFLILHGGFFMDRESQEKLSAYVASGGKLIVVGELPQLDGEFQKCTLLKDKRKEIPVVPEEVFFGDSFGDLLIDLGVERRFETGGAKQVWLYDHSAKDVQYLFVLAKNEEMGLSTVRWNSLRGSRRVEVQIAGGTGAVVRIEDGKLSAAMLMGVNDSRKSYIAPLCRIADSMISADVPCDLVVIQKSDHYEVKAANIEGDEVDVRLPDGQVVKLRGNSMATRHR